MENLIEEKELELRMYFFVPYNISGRQMGIQAGHALGRYALRYGRFDPHHIVWNFLEKFETFIVLNGGTTNDTRDFDAIPAGNLNKIGDQLNDNDIEFGFMIEPDLNNALSALCFIADERVFNRKDYPDFNDYLIINYNDILDERMNIDEKIIDLNNIEQLKVEFPETYKEWVRFMGGIKNTFLRELIKDKKLA